MLRLRIPITENISGTFVMAQQFQERYKKKQGAHLHISNANISVNNITKDILCSPNSW